MDFLLHVEVRRGLDGAEVLRGLNRRLAEVAGEHVLSPLALAVASVAHDGEAHVLVVLVLREDLLEGLRQRLEVRVRGELGLEDARLHLDLVLEVVQWGAQQVALVLLRRHRRVRLVAVVPVELVEGTRPREVVPVAVAQARVLVQRHHVLHVVTATRVLGALHDTALVGLLVDLLIDAAEALLRLVVEAPRYRVLERLSRVLRVRLAKQVLRRNAAHKTRVARHALVPNLVHGSIHPGAGGLAHVADGAELLRLLSAAVDRGRAHHRDHAGLFHLHGTGLHEGGVAADGEVAASLTIALARGVADDVLLARNVPGVARDLGAAVHFFLCTVSFAESKSQLALRFIYFYNGCSNVTGLSFGISSLKNHSIASHLWTALQGIATGPLPLNSRQEQAIWPGRNQLAPRKMQRVTESAINCESGSSVLRRARPPCDLIRLMRSYTHARP